MDKSYRSHFKWEVSERDESGKVSSMVKVTRPGGISEEDEQEIMGYLAGVFPRAQYNIVYSKHNDYRDSLIAHVHLTPDERQRRLAAGENPKVTGSEINGKLRLK
jgi:hypothetical protein